MFLLPKPSNDVNELDVSKTTWFLNSEMTCYGLSEIMGSSTINLLKVIINGKDLIPILLLGRICKGMS